MEYTLGLIAACSGLISTVCLLVIVIRMFHHHRTLLGISTLVMSLPLVGYVIALVAGWRHRRPWHLRSIMPLFTIALVSFLSGGIGWAAMRISREPDPTVTNAEFNVELDLPEISIE